MSARALPILMYHHVSPSPGLVTMSPENFAAQMAWLADRGYRTVRCEDLAAFLGGAALPERAVMITFDDGYLDNYLFAYPILKRHGLHAVLFGVTDWLGDGPARDIAETIVVSTPPNHRECQQLIAAGNADQAIVRWSEVQRMTADGTFEIQSHTASHTRWDKRETGPTKKAASLEADLVRARGALGERLGLQSDHLCWPQGYFDADYVGVATRLGYRHLYTTRPGTATTASDPALLPRIVVKDKGADWLAGRLRIYRSPLLARLYGLVRGH